MITYKKGILNIALQSQDPAADHAQLLEAILIVFRLVSLLDDSQLRLQDRDRLIPLIDLWAQLAPSEIQLEKIYATA